MTQFILSAWRAGLRGRIVQIILVLGVALVGVAFLAAGFSPRQPKTVTLDVGLSGLRIALVLLAVYWVQEFFAKELERKTVLFSLAYPVDRAAYLLGRFFGVLSLLLLATLLFSLLLWLAVLTAGSSSFEQGQRLLLGLPYWLTVLALWLDVVVVATFTLLVAVVATTPMLPLAVGLAFAVAGRALGAVLDYLERGADGDLKLLAAYGPILDGIKWLLPDLSRLDWRIWPMYGQTPSAEMLGYSCLMAVAYVAVLLVLSVQAFRAREFS